MSQKSKRKLERPVEQQPRSGLRWIPLTLLTQLFLLIRPVKLSYLCERAYKSSYETRPGGRNDGKS